MDLSLVPGGRFSCSAGSIFTDKTCVIGFIYGRTFSVSESKAVSKVPMALPHLKTDFNGLL